MNPLTTINACIACIALGSAGFVLEDRYHNENDAASFQEEVQERFLAWDLRELDREIARMRAKGSLTPDEQRYLNYLLQEQRRLLKG